MNGRFQTGRPLHLLRATPAPLVAVPAEASTGNPDFRINQAFSCGMGNGMAERSLMRFAAMHTFLTRSGSRR